MAFLKKFIKLVKSELLHKKGQKSKRRWKMNEKKYLSKTEVKKLITFCNKLKRSGLENKKFTPLRNWFMVELGLHVGLRVQEMADLRGDNLLIDAGKSSINLIGKGDKERTVWISSKFKSRCKEFLRYKKKFGYSVNKEDYILNNLQGTKISKRALQKFFKRIIKDAKLSEHYSIHKLRHTYSTFLLDKSSNNYKLAQAMLGHASIETTQTYAGVFEKKARKAIDRLYD